MKLKEKEILLCPEKINIPAIFDSIKTSEESLQHEYRQLQNGAAMTPIIVAQQEDGSFQLLIGYRRLQIAKFAKFKEISCLQFDDTKESIESFQLLDWIHEVGEHSILRHPDAYQFYKQQKVELVPREFSPQLQSQKAWKVYVTEGVNDSIKKMLSDLCGESNIELANYLHNDFNTHENESLVKIIATISNPSFKIENFNTQTNELIKLLSEYLREKAKGNLAWVNDITVNLPLSTYMESWIKTPEAETLFNKDDVNHLLSYKKGVEDLLKTNTLITKGGQIYKKIKENRSLENNKNNFSNDFLLSLMNIVRGYQGQNFLCLTDDANFKKICVDDFRVRSYALARQLYLDLCKLSADQLTEEYIRNFVANSNALERFYSGFQLGEHKEDVMEKVRKPLQDLLAIVISRACGKTAKLKYHLEFSAKQIGKEPFKNIFKNVMLEKRKALVVDYPYAGNVILEASSSAELLGIFLLLTRFYKDKLKSIMAKKDIFLKPRLPFSVIQDYLDTKTKTECRFDEMQDGFSEISYSFQLKKLGLVGATLKISTHGTVDMHVAQVGSYRNESDKEGQRSNLCAMVSAIMEKAKQPIEDREKLMTQWVADSVKFDPVDLASFDRSDRARLQEILTANIFTLFFVEGWRCPSALLIHPLILKELIDNPRPFGLDNAIVDAKLPMTAKKSKPEGQALHRFFQSKSTPYLFQKTASTFKVEGIANKEVEVLREQIKQKTPFDIVDVAKNSFGLKH